MKHIVAISLMAFAVSAYAQHRLLNFLPEEKQLVESEARRYQALLHQPSSASQTGDSYDVTYYKLNLRISTPRPYIQGVVTVSAFAKMDSLASMALDLTLPMVVDSVRIGNSARGFSQTSDAVLISLDRVYGVGDRFTVDVYYEGVPRASGFGSFVFDTARVPTWVWSLSEPYGARDWWPCKNYPSDKADSADIIVTCDSAFKVGSNGKLQSVINNGEGTATWHWQERYPISSYLISVTLSNFSKFSNWFRYSPADSMEVLNFILPEHLSQALANLPRTTDMLAIYSDLFGLYPFIKEKYGHAEFGWGGGMEHQTMTSLTSSAFGEYVVSHELAHQWFGDMITCRTWQNIWLNEGFAQYCTALYYERKYGRDTYLGYMDDQMVGAKSAVGSVFVKDTTSVNNIFNGNLVYSKGASVLHMLRHVLGDTVFFRAMYSYANDPGLKYGTAATDDFKSVCENVSGKNLEYFFNEWIYGENYPQYEYSWSSRPSGNDYLVYVSISQTTGTTNPPYFTMPIDLKFIESAWDTVVTVFNDTGEQTFAFNMSHNPSRVLVDPDRWILKDTASVAVGVHGSRSQPLVFSLEQNYPNPFNPSTRISYQIPTASWVTITVYNTLGMEVVTLANKHQEAGEHWVIWDGRDNRGRQVASGVYLYKIGAGRFSSVRKMVVVR